MAPGWLLRWLRGADSGDGFGQSLADDLRFAVRFRRCRRRAVAWRMPSPAEDAAIEAHPIVGRFGDATVAVADVDGDRWIVRDRMWFGWPDPPEYAFFVLREGEVHVAVDFDRWPPVWVRPARSTVGM